jgi:hypothetical protein
MTSTSWKTILYMQLRPLSNHIFMNPIVDFNCKALYTHLGHHEYRLFIEFFSYQLADLILNYPQNEKPHLIYNPEKQKYYLDSKILPCFLELYYENLHLYELQDGTLLSKAELPHTPRKTYARV